MRGIEIKKNFQNCMMDFSKISIFVISRQNGCFREKIAKKWLFSKLNMTGERTLPLCLVT